MSPLLEAAAAVTLILGCLTGIGVLLRRLWNGMRKAVHVVELINKQLTPNGGGSVYDMVSTAAKKAEHVAEELAVFREHQAADTAATTASIREMRQDVGRVQHDVTNIRSGQEALLELQDRTDRRVTDHRDRNAAQVRALQAAVDDLTEESRSRDKALGDALSESLDVAIIANEAQED